MQLGFPTNPCYDILGEIEWIGKNGFDYADLFVEEPSSPEKINATKVAAMLKRYSLGSVGHIAWHIPIGSAVKSRREAAVKEVQRHIMLFSRIGTEKVTVHSNWPEGKFSVSDAINYQTDSLLSIVDEGKKRGIKIMYEPLYTRFDDVKSVEKILATVPDIFLNLDIGHANLFGRDPVDFIRKFGKKIIHVHAHDNDGVSDLHMPIGCGVVDWERVIESLKRRYDGTITLEVFVPDRSYALLSRDIFLKMWKGK